MTLALAALWAFGCDADVMVQGRAYRWIDPQVSSHGQVLIDAPHSHLPSNIEPLAGAKIKLYRSEDGARRLDPKDQAWRTEVTSESDGSFMADGACAGGSYDMAVLLVCPQVK